MKDIISEEGFLFSGDREKQARDREKERAISTRYKGCLFRSRNEARWAVFFKTLGIAWTYEPEGFHISNYTGYLPDFYIEPWQSWVEIKSKAPTCEERTKCRSLCDITEKFVILLAGEPYPARYQAFLCIPKNYPWPYDDMEDFFGPGELSQSRNGHGLWFDEPCAMTICLDHTDHSKAEDSSDMPLLTEQLQRAFDSARSARFEYGAQG
jgi:hypothetical protein